MPTMRLRHLLPAALLLPVVVGCHLQGRYHPDKPYADQAWVRLNAVAGQPAVAYLTIHGGKKSGALTSVETQWAMSSELHDSMQSNGMASMASVSRITLPKWGTVTLKPGGYHVMLMQPSYQMQPGGTVHLVAKISTGTLRDRDVPVEAKIVAAGDPAPY
jgi:copper(I)-binding protein